jgi:hypothetical protein
MYCFIKHKIVGYSNCKTPTNCAECEFFEEETRGSRLTWVCIRCINDGDVVAPYFQVGECGTCGKRAIALQPKLA